MSKPTLSINQKNIDNKFGTLGLTELICYLRDSGEFDISYHDEEIKMTKGDRAGILYFNGKKIYLDVWEYSLPTYSKKVYNSEFDLIIKLQHPNWNEKMFNKKCNRKKILDHVTPEERMEYIRKIVPWTFFASRMLRPFIDNEDAIVSKPIERTGFFCGKAWRSRKAMTKKIEEIGIEVIRSNQGTRRGKPLSNEDYLHKMQTSKYGLVLHGRGSHVTEAKNRREIDYMLLKKPLLLNYKPNYYNPLVKGKHYIHINEKTDFEKIESEYNIDEIAEAGYQWYLDNASPNGVVKTFLQIMNERLGV